LSAYGVNFSDGGVALIHLPENSDAAKLGFMSGDLIQEINKVKIKNISDFIQFVNTNKNQSKFEIHFIRNQVKSTKTIDKMGDITH
jgi:S1-C subfamily serine protease